MHYVLEDFKLSSNCCHICHMYWHMSYMFTFLCMLVILQPFFLYNIFVYVVSQWHCNFETYLSTFTYVYGPMYIRVSSCISIILMAGLDACILGMVSLIFCQY